MIISTVFFILFGAMGLHAALKGQRNVELWLVLPPVILSVAAAVWRGFSGDEIQALFLSALVVVFAASAAGALIGMGIGRMRVRRRAQA